MFELQTLIFTELAPVFFRHAICLTEDVIVPHAKNPGTNYNLRRSILFCRLNCRLISIQSNGETG